MSHPIVERIHQIKAEIPSNVRLVAVSKTVSVENMRIAYEAGIRDFGENRLQEALTKQAQLQDLRDICWHFIGHLQSNKAKKAVESFSWIHAVDNLKIAQRLDNFTQQALANGEIIQAPQVCLQVKILPDPDKYGWTVEQLWQNLELISQLKYLRLRGLMAILPLNLSASETLSAFQKVQQLATEIQQKHYFSAEFNQLSMGMSGDYPLAIQAGATMIRLGTIIFGARSAN